MVRRRQRGPSGMNKLELFCLLVHDSWSNCVGESQGVTACSAKTRGKQAGSEKRPINSQLRRSKRFGLFDLQTTVAEMRVSETAPNLHMSYPQCEQDLACGRPLWVADAHRKFVSRNICHSANFEHLDRGCHEAGGARGTAEHCVAPDLLFGGRLRTVPSIRQLTRRRESSSSFFLCETRGPKQCR